MPIKTAIQKCRQCGCDDVRACIVEAVAGP